jgi:hypothetical protein
MSDNPGTNITLAGDWSKPVNTFIEKVSNALGRHFEPHYVRKLAHARADAAKIEAAASIEVTELQQRALRRLIAEEAKRQDNIEAIVDKALHGIADDAKTENVEDDWLTNFFDKCRIISDEDMQTLWSKLLAGEANHPGSFSKRTVNFLASLSTKEAALFATLCRFCWQFEGLTPLIYQLQHPIYTSHGITFDSVKHFDDVGLLTFAHHGGYAKENLPQHFTVHYFTTPVIVDLHALHRTNYRFDIGLVFFSAIAHDLARIVDAQPIPAFLDYVVDNWRRRLIHVALPEQPAVQ